MITDFETEAREQTGLPPTGVLVVVMALVIITGATAVAVQGQGAAPIFLGSCLWILVANLAADAMAARAQGLTNQAILSTIGAWLALTCSAALIAFGVIAN